MRHLFSSRVAVYRQNPRLEYGTLITSWEKVQEMIDPKLGIIGEMRCRLDLAFLRVGKDEPIPITKGYALDRVGVLFCSQTNKLKAGDRIETLSGPIEGRFEIRAIPDDVPGYSTVHHMEISIIEVSQFLDGVFPGAEAQPHIVEES